jgi:hypothetical protein
MPHKIYGWGKFGNRQLLGPFLGGFVEASDWLKEDSDMDCDEVLD